MPQLTKEEILEKLKAKGFSGVSTLPEQDMSAAEDNVEKESFSPGRELSAFGEGLEGFTPNSSDPATAKSAQRLAGAAIGGGGSAAAGGGAIAIAISSLLGGAFPPESAAEATADVTGAGVEFLLNRAAPGSGTAAMQLRRFLGKEGMKQAGKKAAATGAGIAATQLPLIATGQSDPGTAASLALSSATGEVIGAGIGRGIAAAMGMVNPSEVASALRRIKVRQGKFGTQLGTVAESGGRGLGLLQFFRGGVGTEAERTKFRQPLEEMMLEALDKTGGIGEVPFTSQVVRDAERSGFEFSSPALDKVQERMIKKLAKNRIEVEPAYSFKTETERDVLTGRILPGETINVPAKMRPIEGGDIIGVNPKTGQLIVPKDSNKQFDFPEGTDVFRVDPKEMKQLVKAMQKDPGSFAKAIGRDGKNLPLVAGLKRFSSEDDWKVFQKAWMANFVGEALVQSADATKGSDLRKLIGPEAALDHNTFVNISGQKLKKLWDNTSSQKKLLMLDEDAKNAINDIVTVVEGLDLGAEREFGGVTNFLRYGFNKVFFGLSSATAAGATALGVPGVAEVGAGLTVVGSLGALVTQALTDPSIGRAMRSAAKGDIGAGRQIVRMMASNPDLVPIMHDDETIEFVQRPGAMEEPLFPNKKRNELNPFLRPARP